MSRPRSLTISIRQRGERWFKPSTDRVHFVMNGVSSASTNGKHVFTVDGYTVMTHGFTLTCALSGTSKVGHASGFTLIVANERSPSM